jgi:LmbE family N-acetylglucosaminyl deacetylase
MSRFAALRAGFEALPQAGLDLVLAGRRPLILAPHPDDESLGCGGLIAAACRSGLSPTVAILTDGSASHPGSLTHPPRRLRILREEEATRAAGHLGLAADNLRFLRFEDTRLPADGPEFDRAVARLAVLAASKSCGIVIGPWSGDLNGDHQAGAAMAAAVAKRARLKLLSYPMCGWLRDPADEVAEERAGGWRLDIAPFLGLKRRAIAAYDSQYGALITDAPGGHRDQPALLAICERPYEVYIGP